jgi:hypothetical protein
MGVAARVPPVFVDLLAYSEATGLSAIAARPERGPRRHARCNQGHAHTAALFGGARMPTRPAT